MESSSASVAQKQQLPSASSRAAILTCLGVLLLAALAIFELKAPEAASDSAPPTEFSAERALAHVRAIARVPHPIGAKANSEAREYLLGQLSALGMNPQVVTGVGVDTGSAVIIAGRANDIVGRLAGAANSGAILLMAHYDSVPSGPGAGDDGAGVAAILEGVRALKAGPALKNDLIVLLTDGEEEGLLGAEAFVAAHPWMKDVGLVMNFEGRGDRGPSLLFETSADNAVLVNEVARAAPAAGSSLFYAFYRLLPNDTDFTRFRPSGIPGLNFAFGGRLEAYHSWLDTPENLDAASLQHHGSYLLSLARHFGQMDLAKLKQQPGDDVFFDWFGSSLITYSERWVRPGQAAVTLLLAAVVFAGLRRGEVRPGRLLAAIAVSLLLLIAVPCVMTIAGWLCLRILSGHQLLGDTPANSFLLVGFTLWGAVSGCFVVAKLRTRFNLQELSVAGLTVVCILSWSLALLLPAGNYLLFWPLLFAACGLLVVTVLRAGSPSALAAGMFPAAAAAIMLFAPVAYLLYVFLTLNLVSISAVGLLLGLFFLICMPVVNIAVPRLPWGPILLPLLLAAAACAATGIVQSHFSSRHPRHDSLLYSLNADDRTAVWVSDDASLDAYTAQFLGEGPNHRPIPDYLTGSRRSPFSASATAMDLLPPVAEIKVDEQQSGFRRLRMNARSQRDAGLVVLRFDPAVKLVSIEISGRKAQVPSSQAGLQVRLYGMGAQGADLDLSVDAPAGVSFWISDYSIGLPTALQRPPNLIAAQGSDQTLVSRKYTLR